MINPYIVAREKRLKEIITNIDNGNLPSLDDLKILMFSYKEMISSVSVLSANMAALKKERDKFMNKWWESSHHARMKAWEDQVK